MTSNANGASRKPSGSSTNSGGQSPSGSPNTAHGQRKLTPASANNMFGVGMAGSGLKTLNGGWHAQVWNGSGNSKRTASISSAASITDPPPANDTGYRSPIGDSTWNTPRAPGSWDISPGNAGDVGGSPKKKDHTQSDAHSPNHAYSLQQARQRQATAAQAAALSAPRIVGLGHEEEKRLLDEGERSSKGSSFSPQRFDSGAAKSASPTRSGTFVTSSPFTSQPTALPIHGSNPQSTYDASQGATNVDELSLGLRGMVVEDDYGAGQGAAYRAQQHPQGAPPSTGPPVPQVRTMPPMQPQPPRPAYGAYPPADYSAYYTTSAPGREQFTVEYPYGYDTYGNTSDPTAMYGSAPNPNTAASPGGMYPSVSPQAMHPHAHPDLHRNQGMFYEYNGAARPSGSQYFYPPHQAVVFHPPPPTHSPMPNPQLTAAVALNDKKREIQASRFRTGPSLPPHAHMVQSMQYTIQQQHQQLSHQQSLILASMRHSTPSPHPQAYPAGVEYTGQLPVMLGGGVLPPGTPVYAHAAANPHAMHLYQQGMRPGRRNDANDSGVALRSALLDEFRANKARKWELRDIFGYVVEFSGDQHGSRFIQQKLESATSEEKQIVFDEIVPDNALQLIQDVFGNYVIQKLFEHGTQVQKTVLANTMEGHILALSLQMYGCRVVQKAVEYILPEQQAAFVKELDNHVLKCVKDANGNHVIQKLIERVSSDRLGFVNAFKGNVYELSTHPYGCRVLQRCFEHLSEEQNRPLLEELHKYTINLMQDQFGNYVVQFVLEHGRLEDRALIVSKLRGQMLHMARHKFASNVCEKALIMADADNRRILIDEIMTPKQDGVSPIVTMMKDQFANYVLQRSLMVVEGDQKEELVSKIRPQLVSMRRYSSAYSKHLISIERLLEKCAPSKTEDRSLNIESETA